MLCRIANLHDKEVINVCDGSRLGCVDDVEVDTGNAQLTALVIFGRPKFLGLFGHEDDIVIPWREIEIIGEETILVSRPLSPEEKLKKQRRDLLKGVFSK